MNTKNSVIRDLIIPLDRYPHLNEKESLQEAIQILMSFQSGQNERLRYSMLLVINDQNQLVGKLSMIDVIHGLVPLLEKASDVEKFEGKQEDFSNLTFLYEDSTFATCGENQKAPIKPLIKAIDFFLPADTHILKALVMMSRRNNYNVPVTENGSVIGILRLEEIFKAMCTIYCPIQEKR